MKTHVRIGYELMSRVAFLSSAAQIVLTHHERFDGKGYPQGLAGEEIPLGARIVAVANAFDSMTSDLPYRQRRPYSVARAEIQREAGKQFNPEVVGVLCCGFRKKLGRKSALRPLSVGQTKGACNQRI